MCKTKGSGPKHKIHIDEKDHNGILDKWEGTREMIYIGVILEKGRHHIKVENLEPLRGNVHITDLYVNGFRHKIDDRGDFNI